MDSLQDRLRERWTDVCEWVDYRPDADFRWLAPLPLLLAGGWLYGSTIGLGIAVGMAVFVTAFVALAGLATIAVWIVTNTVIDLAYSFCLPAPKAPTRVKILSDRP
jgi:hypothetical protein